MMGKNMMTGSGKMGGMMKGNMTGMPQHQSIHDMVMAGISNFAMKQQVMDEMDRHHLEMKALLDTLQETFKRCLVLQRTYEPEH